jgi:hypothetical protein
MSKGKDKVVQIGQLDGGKELKRILGELAGFASLCWEPKPTGEFDSKTANEGVDKAFNEIINLLKKF